MSKPDVESSSSGLETLAATLAAVRYEALDPVTQDCARQRLFDTLGATRLGLLTPEGERLTGYAARVRNGREPDAAVLCRLYVGATRTTEIDDIDIASCTTVGSVVVPAALAAAVSWPLVDDRTLLSAIVCGYEAMMRFGRAIGGATLLYRGVWPTYAAAAFAAAATAAKVLGLDERATARALALAATRSAALPAAAVTRFGFRYYALGCAAAEGIDAAVAAAAGIEIDPYSLTSYAERLGVEIDSVQLARAAGPWLIRFVDTKFWPTSRQALTAVAAFALQRVAQDALPEIDRIIVHVPDAYRDMVDRAAPPTTRIESMIGVQYQFGLIALEPERLYDVLRSALPARAEFGELARKVEVRADDALGALFPNTWGGRVTLRRKSGRETVTEELVPQGSGPKGVSWAQLERKLARIYAASGVDLREWLATLRERCAVAGEGAVDVGAATGLVALLADGALHGEPT